MEDLSSFFIEFLRETQREGFAELLKNTVKTHFVLEVFALFENRNIGLSEDGKLGVNLLLGSAGLRAEQLLKIPDFLAILERVCLEGCL